MGVATFSQALELPEHPSLLIQDLENEVVNS